MLQYHDQEWGVPVHDDRKHAHMQAVGMVNDHLVDCFRYREIRRIDSVVDRLAFKRRTPDTNTARRRY